MLCGVTATLGSNPSATATAARPQWGRAVLLCLPDLWARSLGVPVGGGPPASRLRCEPPMLRVVACGAAGVLGAGGPGRPRDRHTRASLGVVDLEARPCPPVPPAPSTPVGLGVLTCACASARSPAVPSAPSGALHTSGARSLMCALRVDSLSGQAPSLPINFARNSPAACSNIECASLELQRFWGVSKNDHDKLRAKFGRRWCRCCPWAPQPGPVGQTACLSETAVAFAGAGRASTETAIAFAGAKWVFLARFSAALVLVVSMVAVQGCAVVMVASCWPVSVAVEVSLVASSPCGCALCVKKFAMRGLLVATAVESSPCMRKTRQIGPFWASRASFVPHMR